MLRDNTTFTPELLTSIGAGLLSGNTWNQQLANAGLGASTALEAQKLKADASQVKSKTLQMLQAQNPDLANAVAAGIMSPQDAYSAHLKSLQEAKDAAKPKYQLQNINGRLVRVDVNSGKLDDLGNFADPNANIPAGAKDFQYQQQNPAYADYVKKQSEAKDGNNFEQRKKVAAELGMTPDDPSYKSFIATGKMAREDQQALTAVDKKAILEADEMVAVNTAAIDALKQAKDLSDKANAGWFSGTRASVGANLPDWVVPDGISSPESSDATINFDNAVVGQALTQLKAIFGGAPTEGERKILLDLQGSSNLPAETRKSILDRAIVAAERRLQFNQERSDSLRGGTFYKSQVPSAANTIQPNLAQPNIGVTKSGVKFSVEQPQ